jgi:RNA polymerase sigma-B factor
VIVGGTPSLQALVARAEALAVQSDALRSRVQAVVRASAERREAVRISRVSARKTRRSSRRHRQSLKWSLDLATAHQRYARTRDPFLRARLVAEYRPNAVALAKRFANRGEPLDDLVQVAHTALVAALERYDPARGISFPPYLERSVAGELKRHFRDKVWPLRVPRGLLEQYLACRAASERLAAEFGRAVTPGEVADALGVTEDSVLEAMEVGASYRLRSLDAPLSPHDDRVRDIAADDAGFDDIDSTLGRAQLLAPLLAGLDPGDAALLRAYYIDGKRQQDLADVLGISQVTVSRRLSKIIERLRSAANALG